MDQETIDQAAEALSTTTDAADLLRKLSELHALGLAPLSAIPLIFCLMKAFPSAGLGTCKGVASYTNLENFSAWDADALDEAVAEMLVRATGAYRRSTAIRTGKDWLNATQSGHLRDEHPGPVSGAKEIGADRSPSISLTRTTDGPFDRPQEPVGQLR